jgi:hypothetical protein
VPIDGDRGVGLVSREHETHRFASGRERGIVERALGNTGA